MSNQFTLQVSRLGKSSSMKSNLGLGSETPSSLDSPLKPLKAFPKGLLDLKKVMNLNALNPEITQTQATQRSKRESRAGLRNKTEEKRKIETNVPSTGKLSDKGSEYTGGRDSAMKDLKLDHFDYASLLMYFPDNSQVQSARPSKKAFNSFKELVKTSRGGYDELLEDIVKDSSPKKRPLAIIQKEIDQIEVVKKVLEYNKSQKNQYVRTMMETQTHGLLPMIKQNQLRTKKALKIKVMPSKKLDDKGATFEVVKEFKNSVNPDEILERGHKSTPSSPLHRRRDSKIGRTSVQRLEDKIGERIFSVYNYKIFWSHDFTNSSTWKPGVREGHTFTTVGKYVVLYGGVSNALLEDIVFYDPTRNIWVKPKVTGEVPMQGRHGHTACEFKKNLIIFGGEQHFNATLSIRECLNDVRMFTPETNEWKYVRVLSHSITPRRYHAATLYDHTMFVYGGINNEGVYLKDVWTFSLRSYIWTKAEIPGEREPGIAFHTMTACFIDRSTLNGKDKEKTHAYEEGIYVFGGKDGEGTILNSLKMFSADVKNTQWKYPAIKGTPPVARYNHSALFYEPLGLLVIYGGKNETLFGTTYDVCLNDIKILHLEQMTWAETTSHGHRPQVGRYHHAVAAFGTKMLIFGGVELYQYADEEVKFVELNQVKARRLIETDEYTETAGHRRKSQPGALAGLMGDNEAFANNEFQAFEEFYSKDIVTWQPMPQAQMNYPEGEKEIRLKLIENIQQREKFSDSPRHRNFKRVNTFLVEE